jgi:hypothetical protein
MPWQQEFVDVALEVDPATGHLWYREVVVTVPRQSGKTTLLLPKWVWRAEAAHLLGGRQVMLYAAQTKQDAIEKFDDDFIEDLAAARVMRGRYRPSNSGGRKRIRFRSGSLLSPVATLSKSGHGKTLDDGNLDEAWAQVDGRVEAAWRPAMITRPQAQLWVMSTAGTEASTYLNAKVQRSRAIVESRDPTSRLAYIEYGFPPDADPLDPATWWSHMPALGFTINQDAIAHELETIEGGLPEFLRAYGNVYPDGLLHQVLPAESWAHCRDPESIPVRDLVFSLDVAPDRASGAIGIAGLREDRLPHVGVTDHRPGTEWMVARARALQARHRPRYFVVDPAGPVGSLIPALERARVRVQVMTTRDMAQACGALYDAVITEQVRHKGQQPLDDAIAGAARRDLGDAWAWKRRSSVSDISPLVAMTAALWGLSVKPSGGAFAARA